MNSSNPYLCVVPTLEEQDKQTIMRRNIIIRRGLAWVLLTAWLLVIGFSVFTYIEQQKNNKEQESILLMEIKKSNELAAETYRMRPIWTQQLSDIREKQELVLKGLSNMPNLDLLKEVKK